MVKIGSTLSKEFSEIFKSIEFMGRRPNIKEFNPKDLGTFGTSFILLDGKPGLYYYDGELLAYSIASTKSVRLPHNTKAKIDNSIKISFQKLDNLRALDHNVVFYTYFDAWNEELAIKASARVRSIMNKCKYHASDWKSFCNYFYSERDKISDSWFRDDF